MSKVIDTRTVLKELEYRNDDNIGVFVDVFPLDGLPKEGLRRKFHMLICKTLSKILYTKKEIKKKSIIDYLIILFTFPFSEKKVISYLIKKMKKYKYKECDEVTSYSDQKILKMPKSLFNEKQLHQFEDTKLYIHNGYDVLLRMMYGDYMQLPPEKERIPHHIASIYWK